MAIPLLFDLFHKQTQITEQAVQSWQAESMSTISLHDVSDLVEECLRYPANMRRAVEAVHDRARVNQLESFDATGRALRDLFDQNLRVVETVRQRVREMAQVGRLVPRASDLDQTVDELQRLKHSFFEYWFSDDPAEIQEALEAARRGEGRTVEEILEELFQRQGKTHPVAQ
jgi:hypothetical protein